MDMRSRAVVMGALLGLCLLGAGNSFAEEGGRKRERAPKQERERKPKQPSQNVTGIVAAVDTAKREISVYVGTGEGDKKQSVTYTLGEKMSISFRGPILDGVRPGDKVQLKVVETDINAKTVVRMTVSRTGYGGEKDRPKREKKDRKPKEKKDRKPPRPEENLDEE